VLLYFHWCVLQEMGMYWCYCLQQGRAKELLMEDGAALGVAELEQEEVVLGVMA
jgi:hypothetical protein